MWTWGHKSIASCSLRSFAGCVENELLSDNLTLQVRPERVAPAKISRNHVGLKPSNIARDSQQLLIGEF